MQIPQVQIGSDAVNGRSRFQNGSLYPELVLPASGMSIQAGKHHGAIRCQSLESFHILVQHDAQVQRAFIVKLIRG